jgi:cephalosporin hydroxylase
VDSVGRRLWMHGRRQLRRASWPLRTRLQSDEDTVDRFHRLYYDTELVGGTWGATHWLRVPVGKTPLDLWIYQEIVVETRPDLIIETGTFKGGSALFFASLFDLLGEGQIVTIDVDAREGRPEHPRITYLHGSSTDPEIVARMHSLAGDANRVMVVLDSDHRDEHVLNELRAYCGLVSSGCYLVVEDTNINGHPVVPEFGPGPTEALETFLAESDDFTVDRSREKFLLSFNPGGYLRRG